MTKKFTVKEIWLLDENGNKIFELFPIDLDTMPNMMVEEDAQGGNESRCMTNEPSYLNSNTKRILDKVKNV